MTPAGQAGVSAGAVRSIGALKRDSWRLRPRDAVPLGRVSRGAKSPESNRNRPVRDPYAGWCGTRELTTPGDPIRRIRSLGHVFVGDFGKKRSKFFDAFVPSAFKKLEYGVRLANSD